MMTRLDVLPNAPEPRRINPDEAHAASQAGRAVLLDVRDARLFDNAHLDRAVPLPLAELEAAGGHLPARIVVPDDPLLVLYCA
jgi:rhodanese-related sulfurtransferase